MTDTLNDLLTGIGSAAAYSAVGLLVLVAGFVTVDLATPGNLRRQIWEDKNKDLTAVLASGLIANTATIVVAILSSNDELDKGLVDAAGYGLLGVILIGLVFKVVDLLTPGDLGAMVADDDHHPAVWITVVTHLAVGAIVAASIS
ncbi:hypothetical protein PAI11_40720 [Patulibacter medicamentivorans]|uniref:DUF350 domain-containing protein n=1 Tax=Patulibacter medicamentivorans TaxID=1097667 RepID=H0EB45_9ACTN|nr:DUF350 domain-containing protein [Patulibacter medicamentivorans]EHN09120.1 hypothetical protein PAI11_40720 [Patulibacter medicamentivorans]